MKKILILALALVMVLSMWACGSDPAKKDRERSETSDENNGTSQTSGDNNVSDDKSDVSSPDTQETGYVGTWKVIPPDSNPFPPLYMVLNEDGTAGWGAKLDNLEPHIWYESNDPDAKENQMELATEDKKGYGDIFYLTEDGRIYMEINLSVGENSYDHIYFERQ